MDFQSWYVFRGRPFRLATTVFGQLPLCLSQFGVQCCWTTVLHVSPKWEKCAIMTSLDLKLFGLGLPNMSTKEFTWETINSKVYLFLAFMGGEIAGGMLCVLSSRLLNPRRAGGGAFLRPPQLRFFADISKTAERSAAVFRKPYPTSFLHRLSKFQLQVIKGQVTTSR